MNTSPTPNHKWRFFRIGGFDQVRLDTAADLVNIGELDPKLWVALACPVKSVAFDAKTLALLDTDGDGYIRVPEVVAAARWVGSVLKDHAPLTTGDGVVPLAAFNDNTDEGRGLLGSARQVLASLGKADASGISAADTADIAAIFAHMRHNGDGIVPAELAADPADAATIAAIVDLLGGEIDRGGKPGVDAARINRFFDEGAAVLAWHDRGSDDAAVRTLGDDTHAAADAFRAVRAKVDDFFTRVQLASFDAKAAAALNPAESAYAAINPATLAANREEIAALPLALVAASASLPLTEGVNPAWAIATRALRDKVASAVLGEQDALSTDDWARICATFDAHEAWQAARPQTPLSKLDIDTLRSHLATGRRERLLALVADDSAAAPEANGIAALDKLLRYCRDLHRFTDNFVSFREFYTRRESIFQAGSLFLDGRSCQLTVPVLDAGKHAALAGLAGIYLVYCDCTRNGEKMTIAAAFTDGEADQLMVGRNGVFWDRDGRDWNATITKIVEHPISIRQAFWTPYKRVARFIGEQVNKFAASKSEGVDKQLAAGVEAKAATATGAAPAPAAPPAPFDIAKFAGIFAAIGLAFGAIGTALAAIATGFLSLKAWQMPLVLLGVMLLISGPSMLLAFLKLRRRNLGPLLDANGWAVNARALINIPFGTSLTRMAELPAGAERSLVDPYAPKRPVWPWLLLAAALAAAGWYGWQQFQQARAADTAPASVEVPAADVPDGGSTSP
ncbi:MAG: hypothetical protein ACLGHG_01460 [Gammaproteobacteria bacterium]